MYKIYNYIQLLSIFFHNSYGVKIYNYSALISELKKSLTVYILSINNCYGKTEVYM